MLNKDTPAFIRSKRNILPFKIIDTIPTQNTQLLLTSREYIEIKTKSNKKAQSPEIKKNSFLKLPRYLSPPTDSLINTWRQELLSDPNTPSSSFTRNLENLRKMLTPLSPSLQSATISGLMQQKQTALCQVVIEEKEEPQRKLTQNEKVVRFYCKNLHGFTLNCVGDLPSSQESCKMLTIGTKIILQECRGRTNKISMHEMIPKQSE